MTSSLHGDRPAAIFDVNETLLDLGGLDAVFSALLGDAGARREWFARLLHLSVVSTALGRAPDFGELGRVALSACAAARRVDLPGDASERLRAAIAGLQPYPDATPALDRLRAAGWRLLALTNSPQAVVERQLAATGLMERLAAVVSVEAAGRFKPAPEPYLRAADIGGAPMARTWMVACHDWDLAGAARVGMRAAYVARAGLRWAEIYERPDVEAPDLVALAERMIAAG